MATNFIPKIVYGSSPTTITFDYPPEKDPFGEEIQTVGDEAISASGEEQFSQLYNRQIFTIRFKALTKTLADAMRTFFVNHASLGMDFKYYPHASESGYETWTLNKKSFKPLRTSSNGAADFMYQVDLEIRRVL